MNDTITVCGIIATEPRHLVTETGIAITSMRLASPSRRWDRATATWTNGATNWFTITAFRSLAANVHKSVKKGDRVVVTGRVRIRTWERDGRGGTSVEIDAEGIGHDLAWGISNWIRVPRQAGESNAGPSVPAGVPTVDPHTGEVTGTVPEDVPASALPTDDEPPVPAHEALGDDAFHDDRDQHAPRTTTEDDDPVVAVLRGTDPGDGPRAAA